jgi:hypothetical protein
MYLGDDAHGCARSCSVLLGRFLFRRYALPGMTGWKRHLANVREVIEIIEAFNMTYTCVPRGGLRLSEPSVHPHEVALLPWL